jgi:uncharacterized membrane protein YjgN (DUF898 family)
MHAIRLYASILQLTCWLIIAKILAMKKYVAIRGAHWSMVMTSANGVEWNFHVAPNLIVSFTTAFMYQRASRCSACRHFRWTICQRRVVPPTLSHPTDTRCDYTQTVCSTVDQPMNDAGVCTFSVLHQRSRALSIPGKCMPPNMYIQRSGESLHV